MMGAVIVVHVAIKPSADYLTRREAYRREHIDRLLALRARGTLIAGGPAPDGRAVDLFYRLRSPDELKPLVEDDPYFAGGAWTGYAPRSFARFVEPWEQPPLSLDGSRRVTIVEGPASEPEMAQLALVELRGAGRLVLGGTFDDHDTLVVLRSADAGEAAGWLAETGFWPFEQLSARPYLYVL
jgi:uncharacterized protein YciI